MRLRSCYNPLSSFKVFDNISLIEYARMMRVHCSRAKVKKINVEIKTKIEKTDFASTIFIHARKTSEKKCVHAHDAQTFNNWFWSDLASSLSQFFTFFIIFVKSFDVLTCRACTRKVRQWTKRAAKRKFYSRLKCLKTQSTDASERVILTLLRMSIKQHLVANWK